MFSHGFNWRGCATPSNPHGFTGENLLAGVVACNVPYHHGGSGIFTSLNPGRESTWGWETSKLFPKKIGENTFLVGQKTKMRCFEDLKDIQLPHFRIHSKIFYCHLRRNQIKDNETGTFAQDVCDLFAETLRQRANLSEDLSTHFLSPLDHFSQLESHTKRFQDVHVRKILSCT